MSTSKVKYTVKNDGEIIKSWKGSAKNLKKFAVIVRYDVEAEIKAGLDHLARIKEYVNQGSWTQEEYERKKDSVYEIIESRKNAGWVFYSAHGRLDLAMNETLKRGIKRFAEFKIVEIEID